MDKQHVIPEAIRAQLGNRQPIAGDRADAADRPHRLRPGAGGRAREGRRQPLYERPRGLGTKTEVGAATSTLTVSIGKRTAKGARLLLDTAGGLLTSISSITVDDEAVFIGAAIPAAALSVANLNPTVLELPSAQKSIVIVGAVSGAATWGALLVDGNDDDDAQD